jgi:hypothetical protein
MFARVVESEQSGDECVSGGGAYIPNALQHRPETQDYFLTQAMGCVRKRAAERLKDVFFVVFAVHPLMRKIPV